MQLYEYNAFPSPRRVRIFAAEKGIEDLDLVQIDVPGGAARAKDFLAKNPLGQVPVLELDDGTCISETTAISRYFEELKPEPALYGSSARDKARVEMWQSRLEADLMGAMLAYYHHATPGFGELEPFQNQAWGEKSRDRALATMGLLDGELEANPFIAGEAFSIADITALCAIDFAKAVGTDIPAELVHLKAWHDRVSQRASARA